MRGLKGCFSQILYRIYLRLLRSICYSRMVEIRQQLKQCGNNVRFLGETMVSGCQYISIGDNFSAGNNCRIEAIALSEHPAPVVSIGKDVHTGADLHIGCIERVSIGDGTLLATRVLLIDHSHGAISSDMLNIAPADRPLVGKPIEIGRNCWLGDGVCVLPGVTLGDGVIVGANAVVTHSFPSGSVIAGVPAKLIKQL